MGMTFTVATPAIDDEATFFVATSPDSAILSLAEAKANATAIAMPDSLVIGADTVVLIDDLVLGKPADRTDAQQMLQRLSGRTHTVLTGIHGHHVNNGFSQSMLARTDVVFRPLDDDEINEYLNNASYADKAGAYAIQDEALVFVERISGDFYNIVGFPVTTVVDLFEQYIKSNVEL